MRIIHNPRPQAPEVIQEPKIEEIFIEEIEVAEKEVEAVKETKLIYSEEENKFILIEED